ncbi:hypothetical protein AAEP93_003809 [Penicillium crustosum]
MTFTIENPVLSNAVPATKSLPDKGKDQKVPSLTRLVHHSHVTTEFDPLRFEAAASLQLQLQLEKQYPDTETDTRLIASPYNSVPHLLDISALERQDRLFALALAYLKPIRDDYATAEYTESFNWTEVYDLLRTFSQAENHAWKSQSYYVVIFRSILLPDIDSDRLYDLDAHSHQEAIASGGLLKYWFGAKNDKHRNLATCIWRNRNDARLGGRGPWHAQARAAATVMYEEIKFTTLRLDIEDGVQSWKLISILDDSPRLKCPLENHSQENVAEKQCYSIEVKRLIKGFHNPVSTSLRIDLLIVDEVQTGVGATEGLDFWLLLRQPRYTPTTGSTPSPCPHHPWDR